MKIYQLQNATLQNGSNKVYHIASASNQPASNCESVASLLSVFPQEIEKKRQLSIYVYLTESYLHTSVAQYGSVRDFAARKSNMKTNKVVTAHFSHVKNTFDPHCLRHSRVGG